MSRAAPLTARKREEHAAPVRRKAVTANSADNEAQEIGVPPWLQQAASDIGLTPNGAGVVHPSSLHVAPPDDSFEREADATADRMIGADGACCASCAAGGSCGGEFVRMKRESGDASGGALPRDVDAQVRSATSGGETLPPHLREFFEPRLGRDLGDVRVHADGQAASAAHAIGARAFALGSHIGFGQGAWQPDSREGRKLIGHELAHVAQNDAGHTPVVRRQPIDFSDPAAYDPCAVNVRMLSNRWLLAELENTSAYLLRRKRGEDKYYDYANLMRRLVAERQRRIGMGHAWLGSGAKTVPPVLYQLHAGEPGTFTVMVVDGASFAGEAVQTALEPVMTPSQFDEFLVRNNIPFVDVAEFYRRVRESGRSEDLTLVQPPPEPEWWDFSEPAARDATSVVLPGGNPFLAGASPFLPGTLGSYGLPQCRPGDPPFGMPGGDPLLWGNAATAVLPASGATVSAFDMMARPNLLRNVYSQRVNPANPRSTAGAELQWRGGLFETAAGAGSYSDVLKYQNLNAIHPNFEVFDLATRGGPGEIGSVTHSMSGNPDWYATKFARMTGGQEPAKFNTALNRINTEYGISLTAADLNMSNMLMVPDDHISNAQLGVAQLVADSPEKISPMLDALLTRQPVTAGNTAFSSWNQVQAARSSGALSEGNYQLLLQQLSPLAEQRVVGIGMTTAEIVWMQNIRAATQSLSPRAFDMIAPGELLQVQRLVATGMPEEVAIGQVARGSAIRGGVMGTVMGAGFGGAQWLASGRDPDLGRDILLGLPAQAGGGALGGWAQAQWNARMMSPILNEAMASGTSASTSLLMRAGAMRFGGAGAIGGPVSALTTWGQMGVQELTGTADYTEIDYAALGARSAVSGGIAAMAAELGPLAFSGSFAVAGSEVPVVGTAVGFVVGLGTYFVVDWIFGDDIEESVRESLGERGCVGGVADETPSH